jgi:hypothetical protein
MLPRVAIDRSYTLDPQTGIERLSRARANAQVTELPLRLPPLTVTGTYLS